MDSKEREARRRRQKALRQKQIRRNLIIMCACIAAGITAVMLIISNSAGKKESRVSEASASESVQAPEPAKSAEELSAAITPEAAGAGAEAAVAGAQTAVTGSPQETSAADRTGLFDPAAGNVTPEELPAKVEETAARHPEFYTGELLPATTALSTDRSADFAVSPGVPCGADPVEGEKVVYLTLDDGPSANTITALNILDHYGIKATFFVTGLNPDYFYLIREAYDRGHTVGLHTNSHDYAYVYASAENYYADLNAIGQIVQEQIGFVPCFIRFPGGAANYISHDYSEGIMTFLTQDVGNYGYQYFDWNASSGDGSEVPNAAQLADAAISYDYFDTIVMLSHDGTGKEQTMQALPFIIEYYLSKGYEFRPITRSAYTSHHTVEN